MALTYRPTIQNTMRAISDFAVGLPGSSSPDTAKIFALTPTAICINLLSMIRSRSARLGKLITNIAPFVVLCIAFVKLFGKGQALSWILTHIRGKLMATIKVPDGHPLLQPVKKWMTSQRLKKNARESTLKHQETFGNMPRNEGNEDDDNNEKRDLLESEPNQGRYLCRFKNRLLVFHVHSRKMEPNQSTASVIQVGRSPSEGLEVSISCFSIWAGTSPVHEFLKHIEAIHAASKEANTTLYRPNWTKRDSTGLV